MIELSLGDYTIIQRLHCFLLQIQFFQVYFVVLKLKNRVATYESIQNSLTFP